MKVINDIAEDGDEGGAEGGVALGDEYYKLHAKTKNKKISVVSSPLTTNNCFHYSSNKFSPNLPVNITCIVFSCVKSC